MEDSQIKIGELKEEIKAILDRIFDQKGTEQVLALIDELEQHATESHAAGDDQKAVSGGKHRFNFEAMDLEGNEIRGVIEVDNEEDAFDAVREMGYFPTKISRVAPKKEEDKGLFQRLLGLKS